MLVSDRAVLNGNNVFSIWVVSNKNGTLVFCKRILFSRKFVSKLKYWKRLKLSLIVTEKHADLSNGRLFWKSLVPFFRRTNALSIGFKMKTLTKCVFECWDKNQLKFCRRSYWKKQPFIFTVYYLMNTFFRHL